MKCQNCHEPVEAAAAFCGNCGQPLQLTAATVMPVPATVPSYALALPAQHAGETQALLSVLLGVMGVAGAIFMPLVGLAFGIFGLVMGTLAYSTRHRLSLIGLVASSLAIAAGLGVWAYAVQRSQHQEKAALAQQEAAPQSQASILSTPCYSLGFATRLNIKNYATSCDMSAFNGQTIDGSTQAYKVYANQAEITNTTAFINLSKPAIEKDVRDSLSGFGIQEQRSTTFAGSPAYMIKAADLEHNVSVVEAAVWHQTASGENVFVLVVAATGNDADLSSLEAQWQWK